MHPFGMVRVGLATPATRLANPAANADAVIALASEAGDCDVLLFPELCLTGYTCGDLFQQRHLQQAAIAALQRVAMELSDPAGPLMVVGLPLGHAGRLYNVAAALHHGRILGFVPKQHLPNYKEFYEQRWFSVPRGDEPASLRVGVEAVPFGTDLLFQCESQPELVIGIEICEDLWIPVPPSCHQAQAGATLLLNLSASNEATGKSEYRRDLVLNQSARCLAAYAYVCAGVHESTTDLVFGGHSMIAESGSLLCETKRFQRAAQLHRADIDVERLVSDRRQMSTFADSCASACRSIPFRIDYQEKESLLRPVPAHPFVPAGSDRLADRCQEIFQIQTAGLARRLEVVKPPHVVIGISGGLDSTLALLVTSKTFDLLGWDHANIHGITMPGFGTSEQTYSNATRLMELLGIHSHEVDIRPLSRDVFEALAHKPFGINTAELSIAEMIQSLHALTDERLDDLVFENVQARIRTLLLMNSGFVIGTGDLSELALGWCTYNGDHVSMYNPNASIPKTLVKFLIGWVAEHEYEGPTREVLCSIIDTEISPELLPVGPNRSIQSTEDTIGPYELHDFFLYHMIRFGYSPAKILWLSRFAKFDGNYTPTRIKECLQTFYRRFFVSQYKRSCLPDGPKVGSISLSPRGDWRMPSDAEFTSWLNALESDPG